MTWLRLDDNMLDHPKWIRALREGGDECLVTWFRLVSWCSRHLTDGVVPADMVSLVAGVRSPERSRTLRALADAGLIEFSGGSDDGLTRSSGGSDDGLTRSSRGSDDGLTRSSRGSDVIVTDYLERNPSREEVLTERSRKAEAQRKRRLPADEAELQSTTEADCNSVPSQSHPNPIPSHPIPEEGADHSSGSAPVREPPRTVARVFDHWRSVLEHPKSTLDRKRTALIRARLAQFSPDDLCRAIDGCAKSDWHMGRDPKTEGKRFDSIELIFRDATHIEQFLDIASGKVTGEGSRRNGSAQKDHGMTGMENFKGVIG